MHEKNSFLTLTYEDEHLPETIKLEKRDIQLWIKRIRKKCKIRYFVVRERRGITNRLHYHVCLFGIDYREHSSKNLPGSQIYTQDKFWQKGNVHIGELNKQTARYITGYIMKPNKTPILTPSGETETEIHSWTTSSGKPGIGATAIDHITEQWLKHQNYEPQLVETLSYGKKQKPLGRYLKNRLMDNIGISEEQRQAGFYDYFEQLYLNGGPEKPGKPWIDRLQDYYKHDRLIQSEKTKIFKQKRNI